MPRNWTDSVFRGAEWIINKRITGQEDELLEGLFPASFSAEHLGPNDYYYWDDFWGAAGLQAAGRLAETAGRKEQGLRFSAAADDFLNAIFRSIEAAPRAMRPKAMPAAPRRRMDAGAIGSMVADWPLKLTEPGNERIRQTLSFLLDNCFHGGGFFQDMIHSGINIYLTLALAQTLLRFEDKRYQNLVEACADRASATGQWPEAVHPFSGGGCMGDGQHGWAAAEWVMMMRSLFVREEDGLLVIGSGIFPQWLEAGRTLFFGPTPTPHGPVLVRVTPGDKWVEVEVEADWRGDPPRLEAGLQGFERQAIEDLSRPITLKRMEI